MRKRAWLLTCLCVALLLGLGLELPRLTLLLQDGNLAREIVYREDVGVALVMSEPMDIFDALALFREADTKIELSEGKQLTQETAAQAAVEALEALVGEGGSFQMVGLPKAVPFLFSNRKNPEQTGIFWRCAWEGNTAATDGFVLVEWTWADSLWLDDGTGKLIGAENLSWRSPAQMKQDRVQGENFDYVQALVEFVGRFCQEYYGLEEVKSLDMTVSSKTGQFSFLLTKENGEEQYTLPVSGWDGRLNLNG